VIGDTDMLQTMQQHALRLAGKALDRFEAVVDATAIAGFIKKVRTRSILFSSWSTANTEQTWDHFSFQSGLLSAGCSSTVPSFLNLSA
jgi:hypothetical protein